MRYRTQAVAYPYFVVAMLFYGLQMAFGLLAAAKYLGPDPIKAWLPFDVVQRDSHQPADRLGAHRLHGRRVLARPGGIAYGAAQPKAGVRGARPVDASAASRRWSGYLFRWTAGNKLLEQPLPGQARRSSS